ncbi:hypothetical protein KQX54_015615 [Cotesia glomerata]|uniref:Uncharacterized protein n=1 Tax=Cotesia glomerata TaxID=32391 RepID=A0AAV7J1V7_COTGL|nr:hypothetical protein KQX54_015615 [Cotesia glomerata]
MSETNLRSSACASGYNKKNLINSTEKNLMDQKNNESNHNFEDKVRESDAEITDTEAKDTEENNKEDNFGNNDDIKEVDPDNNMDIEQLVGYVDEIEACHMAGKNLLFKFILNNNNGRRLQIIAWEGEAERTEPDIAVYKV